MTFKKINFNVNKMKYKNYIINWKVIKGVLFISVNAKPFIFKGIDHREEYAGDLLLV